MCVIAPGLAEQDKPRIDIIREELEIVKKVFDANNES